jgi:hypothetical protein
MGWYSRIRYPYYRRFAINCKTEKEAGWWNDHNPQAPVHKKLCSARHGLLDSHGDAEKINALIFSASPHEEAFFTRS